jgi:phage/plasmid-like protein (TIGR03299 family)
MAHMIDDSTGAPAFVHDAKEGGAWHGLGVAIPEDIATDPAKIAALCHAAYRVHKVPAQFEWKGKRHDVPNREVLIRDDTGEALEVLSGNKFKLVQPVEYFEAFRDSLAKNNLRISSAGVLKGGRIVFVNAKFTDMGYQVLGVDRVDSYVCMGGGYDGTLASFGYLNDFRTVCWNTLSASLAQHKAGKSLFRIPHSAAFDGAALGAALGLAGKELTVRAEVFNTMAGRKAQQEAVAKFFCDVLDIDPATVNAVDKASGKPVLSTRLKNQLTELANAYASGPGALLPSAAGTWWGALNAVTHYVDHVAPTRDSYKDGTDNARFASSQFGTGADTKAKALKLAMTNAGIGQEMLQAA